MQAAGMLRGTGAIRGVCVILLLATLILAFISDNAHAHPLQQLPNIPGWIPVYIRNGDQPLDEINPELAEAFREKQSLESGPLEASDPGDGDNIQGNLENHRASYNENDDVGDLNAGERRKGTIFLIGVRQSGPDGTKNDNDVVPKIALPFEVVGHEEPIGGKTADNRIREKSEDAWIEEHGGETRPEREPIGISKEAIIKASGLPVDVKELERLAAEVEKEETRPNDLYDAPIVKIGGVSPISTSRNSGTNNIFGMSAEELESIETIMKDTGSENSGERTRPIVGPEEFRSDRSMNGERLRPARDPKEFRPDDDTTDFMESEE